MRLKKVLAKALPDSLFLRIVYRRIMRRKLNLHNPRTYNEKLQWLKLYNHNPEYTMLVDKYAVKKYVAEIIGSEYIIPTIGVWNHFDEIDFDRLPDQFVLKCTHNSGGVIVCRDKFSLDFSEVKEKIEDNLSHNFYYVSREWPYKNVPPRIIAEEYMADKLHNQQIFSDSAGMPRLKLVFSVRFTSCEMQEDFYDEVWNHLGDINPVSESPVFPVLRPEQYGIMHKLALKIAEKKSYLSRIDFYEIGEMEYFAEIEFSGVAELGDLEMEKSCFELGIWLDLPGGAKKLCSRGCSIIVSDSRLKRVSERALEDYKFFCFNGEIDSVMVCKGREKGHPDFFFYDYDWKRLYYQQDTLEKDEIIPRPNNFDEMKKVVKKLCAGFPHVRVDLYEVDGNIYFGELTFFDSGGFDTDISYQTDLMWGGKIQLPARN